MCAADHVLSCSSTDTLLVNRYVTAPLAIMLSALLLLLKNDFFNAKVGVQRIVCDCYGYKSVPKFPISRLTHQPFWLGSNEQTLYVLHVLIYGRAHHKQSVR